MTGAQPCWKLAYTGSVGSQVLTGIPVVRALRDDPDWADRTRIWPFETGFSARPDAQIVLAEVWPSWWQVRPELGPPNDKAQVRTVAELFASEARAGELARWLAGPAGLAPEERRTAETEEAWTLGVMSPRRPRRASSPAASMRVGAREARSQPAVAAGSPPGARYTYLRDPAAIYERSFALVREAADLDRFPASLRSMALRLAHAAGDVSILDDLAWSRGAVVIGRRALAEGAPILADSAMVAAGIAAARLPAGNPVICTLRDPAVAAIAAELRTTRSAAAVELWRPHLAGAVVAIGNAPTALFHLLEIVAAGAGKPALVLGFPVGFVGAAEAKQALIAFGRGLRYVALRGRRGGSALAAAAVNALCTGMPA
jgi:precorrin-8X/cobalt-precorrin-8 methylmutase